MKKYKMFNKGASEKDFLHGKWTGNSSDQSLSDSSSDAQTDPNKNVESSADNSTPQTASNGLHYDHYHIAEGELSNKTEKNNSLSNLSWRPNHSEKADGSSQMLSNELPERLSQNTSVQDSDANESEKNNAAAEPSTVMTVALGEIGSISKYVSQGIVGMSEMLSTTSLDEESCSDVPVPDPAARSEGEDDPNIERQPELTIISAFSLSAEMWENGQDKKPEDDEKKDEEETEEENQEQHISGDSDSNSDQNPATELETCEDSKKETVEDPLSCTHSGAVSADTSSHQEHLSPPHSEKKAKVYLHQCSVSDCNYSTNVIREFIAHYSAKHADLSSYVCRWCKSDMNSLSVFVDHVRENFVVPWVKCPHCYLKKKNKSEVVEHIVAEHPGESQRVIAGSMFLCRSSSHSREKESKVVSESHKTLVSLLSNQKYILNHSTHNGKDSIVGIVDPNTSGNGYQCTDCLFNTTNAQVFLAHMKVCDSMKNITKQRNVNFECKECSFATSSREVFLNHSHVKAALMNGMKRAPYKKRPAAAEVRNHKLIRKKVLNIKKQSVALKLKKDKKANAAAAAAAATTPETTPSGETNKPPVVVGGHFKFSCPYCKEKFNKLNRMKFHIFLNHHDSYSQTIPLHQCLSCHMKSSSEEIVRQHIERTHFGRKSGILLINEPPEVIPRKSKTQNTDKKLVKAIAPITKTDPSGSAGVLPKKQVERCSSWGRSQINDETKHKLTEVVVQETKPHVNDGDKRPLPADDKEGENVDSKVNVSVPTEETPPESNVKAGEETNDEPAPPPKNLAMEIVKFTPGDHFTEYIECPQCSYQSRSVMGFYGHIKRHEDLVVHISTRRKYEFHKTKGGSKDEGAETESEAKTDGNESISTDSKTEGTTEGTPSAAEKMEDKESVNENPELKECLSPMSPAEPDIQDEEMAPPLPTTNPPKLESIIINKKSENLIDKDEYSKLGGPILDAKLSSLYTSDEHVKKCNLCGFMAYFPCYIHRHLLSAHLDVHFWECGYCVYRHLQRYKVARHCTRSHTNQEQYVKWLGIPDWEKKLADCTKKTNPAESGLPNQDNPAVKTAVTSPADSPASDNKSSCSSLNITDTPKADGSESDKKTIQIETLPGNLLKCGSCTMCSIDASQIMRHIRYQHNAEGVLPKGKSEIVTTKSEAGVTVEQKPMIPALQPPQVSSQPPVSASPTAGSPSSPVLKKSPTDQASKKPALKQIKPKKKIASSFAVPNTPYRCVFCTYVNMSATEVKKHMWKQHSDELNNVGILLKSKDEGDKASHASSAVAASKVGKPQLGAPIKRKLKRTYRPQKRKKAKTYAKCIKEPGTKKSLTKSGESGPTETPVKRKYVRKIKVNKNVSPSEISAENLSHKRPTDDIDSVSPAMPKKRQIQSTQHSDYEWESPSLAEPPSSKSERIYKSVDKTEDTSYRIAAFERSLPEKASESDVPLSQKYNPVDLTDADIAYNMTMPVFRKAEMDIYKRFIFKTYDGVFLCNYCLISMSDEIQARHHILDVHPKKPTNPLEQPCKTFQLFRKKTRRPEIIVPHAAQPRFNQKPLQNGSVQKKGSQKNKAKSSKKLEKSVSEIKKEKENRASLFEVFDDGLDGDQDPSDVGFEDDDEEEEESTAGRFDENDAADQVTLLKVEGDMNYVFTWKWSDQDDAAVKPPPQRCTDSEQVSVLRLITYRQGKNVAGYFKCPFCQLTSTSHISVSDHIRLDHMELERHKCRECPFKSWFTSLLENHRRLQHVVSPLFATNDDPRPLTKGDSYDDNAECTRTESAVQAPVFPQELCTHVDSKKERQPYREIHIVTDYRTLYLRKFCQKTQAVIFVCKICSVNSPDQNAFHQHVSIHSGRIYSCTACTFSATPKSKLEQHILTDHPPLKANLLILRHESLINVTDNPHPTQIDQLLMDPPLLPAPWMKERTPAVNASETLTYACSDCPFQIDCLKTFSRHLAYHWNEETIFSTETLLGGTDLLLSMERSYDDCGLLDTHRAKKVVDFAASVALSDIFSYYSDNVFSFYS